MKKLNNWLFGNAGKVLKVLSVVFFWLEIVACIVVACFAIVDDPEYLIALAGIPAAWLANLMTYGIGCAVENSFAILAKVCDDNESTSIPVKFTATPAVPAASRFTAPDKSTGIELIDNTLRFQTDDAAGDYIARNIDKLSDEDRARLEPVMKSINSKRYTGLREALVKLLIEG